MMHAALKSATIHLGTSAARQLLQDIKTAGQEVWVLSPCLSAEQMQLLLGLHRRGVRLTLVTSVSRNAIGNVEGYDFRKELIKRVRKKDPEAAQKKDSLKNLLGLLWLLLIGLAAITSWTYYFYHIYVPLTFGTLTFISAAMIYATFRELHHTRDYYFSYRTIFPIRVFIDPGNPLIQNNSRHFLHARAFIIDEKVAYLGSAEFTCSGLGENYESIIRAEDQEAISELKAEIRRLCRGQTEAMDFVDIEEWGRMVYEEPVS
jgi:phosphatidylserine/phosphatidylglycerophosphate/cardiolipin synthase-like enzyme